MAPFVWAACHCPSVNSQLCWNVQMPVAAFITAMFHPFVNIGNMKFVYPLCKTATERWLLSSQLPRSDHIKHSPRAKGRWLKVAVISLELIDWLLGSCFRFIHHPPNSERYLRGGRTLLLWFETTSRWRRENRVAPILLNKSKTVTANCYYWFTFSTLSQNSLAYFGNILQEEYLLAVSFFFFTKQKGI